MKIVHCYFILALCFFGSCDQKNKEEFQITDNDTVVYDPDLSSFTESQIYAQHIMFNVPKEFQIKLDSLVNWVKVMQPGGLNLQDWDLGNIQLLSQSIDTLDIIKPFVLDDYWNRMKSKVYPYKKANALLEGKSFCNWAPKQVLIC